MLKILIYFRNSWKKVGISHNPALALLKLAHYNNISMKYVSLVSVLKGKSYAISIETSNKNNHFTHRQCEIILSCYKSHLS